MPIDTPTVAATPQVPPFTTALEHADVEQRWAAWRAKGAAHDRAVRRRMAVVAPILILVAGVVIYMLGG